MGFDVFHEHTTEESLCGQYLGYSVVQQEFSKASFSYIPTEEELERYYHDKLRSTGFKYPDNPLLTYRSECLGWYDLFGILMPLKIGKGTKGLRYFSLKYFRVWVDQNRIHSFSEYQKLRAENQVYLPAVPQLYYIGRGTSWPALFDKQQYTWHEFKSVISARNIKKKEVYEEECKNDERLPRNPWKVYPEWTHWGEVFGTKTAKCLVEMVSLDVITKLIRDHNIRNIKEWSDFYRSQKDIQNIPSRPNNTYALEKYGAKIPGDMTLAGFINWSHQEGKNDGL